MGISHPFDAVDMKEICSLTLDFTNMKPVYSFWKSDKIFFPESIYSMGPVKYRDKTKSSVQASGLKASDKRTPFFYSLL